MRDVQREFRRVLAVEARALLACRKRLAQPDQFADVRCALQLMEKALDQGGKLVLLGVGKSGLIARKIAATLTSTGCPAVFLHPTEALHGDLGVVHRADIGLVLSHTGQTAEILTLLPALRSLRLPLVGMGGNPHSKLALHCQAWIDASVEKEACPHQLAPTASTTLMLALGDALALTLMQRRKFAARHFARNHPGGTLGRRLTLRVRDLMHPLDRVAWVTPRSLMKEVILAATAQPLGGVLVLQDTAPPKLEADLCGLITDGDLRRALSDERSFFKRRAQKVMTRTPQIIQERAYAQAALQLMRSPERPLNVLPVVNIRGRAVGLLRLHDLVQAI